MGAVMTCGLGALLVLSGCASGSSAMGGAEGPTPIAMEEPEGSAFSEEPPAAGSPAEIVANALEATESAHVFWQEGDTESAIETLDRAYELLLQIPDEGDLARQKEDLRHLISRRVVEIYRSQLTTASELGSSIPVVVNQQVQHELNRFTGAERRFFYESYRRSGQYRPMIVRKLREAGLPEELSWLPLVESGFKNRALSSARALGMWQFISSTGSRYGMQRNHWVDERMDPEKSTDAAIGYLTDLHGMFGDWMLALAGYNCGEHRVMRVIRRQEADYLDHFWDVYNQLPRETARYVPRLLATLAIVQGPGEVRHGSSRAAAAGEHAARHDRAPRQALEPRQRTRPRVGHDRGPQPGAAAQDHAVDELRAARAQPERRLVRDQARGHARLQAAAGGERRPAPRPPRRDALDDRAALPHLGGRHRPRQQPAQPPPDPRGPDPEDPAARRHDRRPQRARQGRIELAPTPCDAATASGSWPRATAPPSTASSATTACAATSSASVSASRSRPAPARAASATRSAAATRSDASRSATACPSAPCCAPTACHAPARSTRVRS